MRTIKFRAWDGEYMFTHENIGDDYDFQLAPNGLILMVNEQFHEMGSGVAEEYWCYVEIKDAKFMQFTGLTDKNGVDIYEGDILNRNVNCMIDQGRVNEEVSYQGDSFTSGDGSLQIIVDSFDPEVIGNIYANPELLK